VAISSSGKGAEILAIGNKERKKTLTTKIMFDIMIMVV
jgi:hypothetical protein